MKINSFDLFLSVIGAFISKLVNPKAVELLRSLYAILVLGKVTRFEPEQFATVILKRNKEVFERLAEM